MMAAVAMTDRYVDSSDEEDMLAEDDLYQVWCHYSQISSGGSLISSESSQNSSESSIIASKSSIILSKSSHISS